MNRVWAAFACLFLVSEAAPGDSIPTPLGRWLTFDDETGKAEAVVRIEEREGALSGFIDSIILKSPRNPSPLCEKCPGAKKNLPFLGLEVLWDLKPDPPPQTGGRAWSGGKALDPESGSVYACRITLADQGAALHLRGYLGLPLFGRSQVWKKLE